MINPPVLHSKVLGLRPLARAARAHRHRYLETTPMELALWELVLLHDSLLIAADVLDHHLLEAVGGGIQRTAGRLAAVLYTLGVTDDGSG